MRNKLVKEILAFVVLLLCVTTMSVAPLDAITVGTRSGQMKTIKVTVTKDDFLANAVTSDVTLIVLPPKTAVYRVVAAVTSAFSCSSTCTSSTLSAKVGKSVGGAEYLLSFDVDAAVAQFGKVDGDMGASLTAAVGPNINWTSNTVSLRLTSGTGAIGTGSATHLATGAIEVYITFVTYV